MSIFNAGLFLTETLRENFDVFCRVPYEIGYMDEPKSMNAFCITVKLAGLEKAQYNQPAPTRSLKADIAWEILVRQPRDKNVRVGKGKQDLATIEATMDIVQNVMALLDRNPLQPGNTEVEGQGNDARLVLRGTDRPRPWPLKCEVIGSTGVSGGVGDRLCTITVVTRGVLLTMGDVLEVPAVLFDDYDRAVVWYEGGDRATTDDDVKVFDSADKDD